MNRTVNIFVHLGDECIILFSWIYTGVGLLAHRFAYNQPYLDFTVVQSGFTNDTTINSVLYIILCTWYSHFSHFGSIYWHHKCSFTLVLSDRTYFSSLPEHHFKCLLAIWIESPFVNYLFMSFGHFCIELSAFFLLICTCSFCVLDTTPISDGYSTSEYLTLFFFLQFYYSTFCILIDHPVNPAPLLRLSFPKYIVILPLSQVDKLPACHFASGHQSVPLVCFFFFFFF